jgi:hypothetical protein
MEERLNIHLISIAELKIGMFVLKFTELSNKVAVKKPVKVPNQQLIDKLNADSIISVTVDCDRSSFDTNIDSLSWSKDKSKSLDSEIIRASKLLKESKATVNKMLESVYSEKTIDLVPIGDVADDIVDSLSNNSDALQSLSALRTKVCLPVRTFA